MTQYDPEYPLINDAYWSKREARAKNAGSYLAGVIDGKNFDNKSEIGHAIQAIEGYASIVHGADQKLATEIALAAQARPFGPVSEETSTKE